MQPQFFLSQALIRCKLLAQSFVFPYSRRPGEGTGKARFQSSRFIPVQPVQDGGSPAGNHARGFFPEGGVSDAISSALVTQRDPGREIL